MGRQLRFAPRYTITELRLLLAQAHAREAKLMKYGDGMVTGEITMCRTCLELETET